MLAEEAAKLAAQLGVSVPELTIPPVDIPLLASQLPDAMTVKTSALPSKPMCNSLVKPGVRLPRKEISGFSAFQSAASFRRKPSGNPEVPAADAIPNLTPGFDLCGDSGSNPLEKRAKLDSSNIQTPLSSIYDISNALLISAKLEVQQMMSQIAAHNARIDQARSLLQAQSAACLPLPSTLAAPTFPAIVPAPLELFPRSQAFPSTYSSAALANFVQTTMMTPSGIDFPLQGSMAYNFGST
jgi:hypothetical protein